MTLGQLRDGAGVPTLIEMTRRDDDARWLRERAIFWLGNADDDRGAGHAAHARVERHAGARSSRPGDLRARLPRPATAATGRSCARSTAALDDTQLKDKVIQAVAQLDETPTSAGSSTACSTRNEPVELRKQALFWRGQKQSAPLGDLIALYPRLDSRELQGTLRVRPLAAPRVGRGGQAHRPRAQRPRSRDPREGDVLARPESRSARREIPRGEDLQMTRQLDMPRWRSRARRVDRSALGAQSIADRVSRAGNGSVRMSFATRPEVCGRGGSISRGGNWHEQLGATTNGRATSSGTATCDYGPGPTRARQARRRDRRAALLRRRTMARDGDGVTDLGTVPAKEAADYLVSLASKLPGQGRARCDLPGDDRRQRDGAGRRCIRLARDEERPRETRKQAVFWLGQAAGDAATAGLDSLSQRCERRSRGAEAGRVRPVAASAATRASRS